MGSERQPPNNIEAEQSVLGAMLLNNGVIGDVVEIIKADDFYRPGHRIIFDLILDLYGRGEPADTITVFNAAVAAGEADRIQGAPYLHTLTAVVPAAASATYYAKIVRKHAILRRLIEAGTRIANFGYSQDSDDVDALVDRAQVEVHQITFSHGQPTFAPIGGLLQPTIDQIEAADGGTRGVRTGFAELDELTCGLQPGQFWVVAARPAHGKSTLGMDFLRSAAIEQGLVAAMFSLEMDRYDLTMRLLSAEAKVNLLRMRQGRLHDEEWMRLARRMGDLAEVPLFIDDTPNITLMEIRSRCRRLKEAQGRLDLVVVDYLQLMTSTRGKNTQRHEEVEEISRGLKVLAKELNVPIVGISQLNRNPENREDGKPKVSDLRSSGSIEQDADVVVLIHQPGFNEEDHPRAGESDLLLAKNRNGPTGTITVAFQGHYSRFADMALQPVNRQVTNMQPGVDAGMIPEGVA